MKKNWPESIRKSKICAWILAAAMLLTLVLPPGSARAGEQGPDDETVRAEQGGETENGSGEAADDSLKISAPSAVLMEASTGTVLYEKDADTSRPPASVTKIMTMLLIFDALEAGSIRPEDPVTTSEYAASMGGSQVFLEAGEVQTVETMLKCIAVASANDACVAMSEFICGSEEEFVRRMNERAKGLGMEQTNFVNCNGLDAAGHETSARDIARMSRELITKYPEVHEYSMIWMENITHTTKKGSSEFGLTNTNKLVRQYEYATGLKTGSTGDAKFCVSATAEKNGVELIAVVMAAETSKERFADAVTLLNYGFGKCQLYTDDSEDGIRPAEVEHGTADTVDVRRKEPFVWLDTEGRNLGNIERTVSQEKISAPVEKGEAVGEIIYSLDGKEVGRSELIAEKSVEKAGFTDYFGQVMRKAAA